MYSKIWQDLVEMYNGFPVHIGINLFHFFFISYNNINQNFIFMFRHSIIYSVAYERVSLVNEKLMALPDVF